MTFSSLIVRPERGFVSLPDKQAISAGACMLKGKMRTRSRSPGIFGRKPYNLGGSPYCLFKAGERGFRLEPSPLVHCYLFLAIVRSEAAVV